MSQEGIPLLVGRSSGLVNHINDDPTRRATTIARDVAENSHEVVQAILGSATVVVSKWSERSTGISRNDSDAASAQPVNELSGIAADFAMAYGQSTNQLCRCSCSPCGPNSAIASTGPSTAPNQCGVHVENSTASPDLMVKSRSPSISRIWPDSTYIQS